LIAIGTAKANGHVILVPANSPAWEIVTIDSLRPVIVAHSTHRLQLIT
jgi:hypothetical protein